MDATCVSTVRTLTNSSAAASRLVAPPAICSATRCSASVSRPRTAPPRRGGIPLDLGQQRPVAHLDGQLPGAPQGRAGLAAGLPPPLDPAEHQQAARQLRRSGDRSCASPPRAPTPWRSPGRRGPPPPGRRSGRRRRSAPGGPGGCRAPAARPRSARVVRPPDRDIRLGQQVIDPERTPGSAQSNCAAYRRASSRCRTAATASPRQELILPRTQAPMNRVAVRLALVVGQMLIGEAERRVQVPGRDQQLTARFQHPR